MKVETLQIAVRPRMVTKTGIVCEMPRRKAPKRKSRSAENLACAWFLGITFLYICWAFLTAIFSGAIARAVR